MIKLDLSKYRKALFLTPHPDDLEGFTGGLVYQLNRSAQITSVIFAGGNLGIWQKHHSPVQEEDYIQVRLEESADAARILGVSQLIYLGYKDREVKCDEDTIEKARLMLEIHQPDLVVSFEFRRRWTPYPHPDHIAVAESVRRAVARYEHNEELDYIVCSTLLPNRFLDVSRVRRIKLEALACHTTQAGLNAVIFPFFEKALSRLWGVMHGIDFAEGYRKVYLPDMLRNLEREDRS